MPLYPTLTAEQIGYMLRDSGARVVFVSTRELYRKVMAAGDIPGLERVVVMDAGDLEGAESFAAIMEASKAMQTPDPELRRAPETDRRPATSPRSSTPPAPPGSLRA